jgi:PAS domain S-box-containing protein
MGIDRKQFSMFLDKILDGFAYHKIVVDKEGKPVDYVFLEVNRAFERMAGLKREQIIGKRATEALLGIEKDPVDWIRIYGRVTLTGAPVQFENYAEPLGKWFKVTVYCPEKAHFVVLFEDITDWLESIRHLLNIWVFPRRTWKESCYVTFLLLTLRRNAGKKTKK